MPLDQVQVIKDVFTKEQKRQIISKLTDAMVSVEGENMRQVTFCLVEEVESDDWGIGGKAMTTADVHALARGKAAWGATSGSPCCVRAINIGPGALGPGSGVRRR
jgi:4-oxalocrotonate tautomerase